MDITGSLLVAGTVVSSASLVSHAAFKITNWIVKTGLIVGPLLLLTALAVAIATGQA